MTEDIRICISSRSAMFQQYYTVPATAEEAVGQFLADMETLGESVADATEFEAQFAAQGFQERFTTLLTQCTPKAYQMTQEEKDVAKETAKEIFREDRGRILKEAGEDVLDYATVMAEEELAASRRKGMIEAGVYDDYTRASNAADIAGRAFGGFKKLFSNGKFGEHLV